MAPFADIAAHVIEAKLVLFLATDFSRAVFSASIGVKPRDIDQLVAAAEQISAAFPTASCGELPFGLRRKTIFVSKRQPSRIALLARQGFTPFFCFFFGNRINRQTRADVFRMVVIQPRITCHRTIFLLRHFVFSKPETIGNLHGMTRLLILFGVFGIAAHFKTAGIHPNQFHEHRLVDSIDSCVLRHGTLVGGCFSAISRIRRGHGFFR